MTIGIFVSAPAFSAQKGRKLLIPVAITLSVPPVAAPASWFVRVSFLGAATSALSIQAIDGTWNAAGPGMVDSPQFSPNGQIPPLTAFASFLDPTRVTEPDSYSANYRIEVFDAASNASQGFIEFQLSGSSIPAQSVDVVFALDHGYRMDTTDASQVIRLDRLRAAFSRAVALFRDDDFLAVATFANFASASITPLARAAATSTQRNSATSLSDNLIVDPTGTIKFIQMGIDAGRALSSTATLVLVTDGENSKITFLGHVLSKPTLPTSALIIGEDPNQIPQSASLMVSANGHYAFASQQTLGEFAAEKLLTQILIGIAGNVFISDPEGSLGPGGSLSFPVEITEADRELELIVFSNDADALEVSFPDVMVAEPADDSEASQHLDRSQNIARKAPPSASDPEITRGNGVLVRRVPALSPRDRIPGRTVVVSRSRPALVADAPVRFNLLVVAKTDLLLDAGVTVSGVSVGSDLLFSAVLSEYGLLWDLPAIAVRVDLSHPDGGVQTIHLDKDSPGRFQASLRSLRAGAYTAHFIATGRSLLERRAFRRECVRTVAVFPPSAPCCPPADPIPCHGLRFVRGAWGRISRAVGFGVHGRAR